MRFAGPCIQGLLKLAGGAPRGVPGTLNKAPKFRSRRRCVPCPWTSFAWPAAPRLRAPPADCRLSFRIPISHSLSRAADAHEIDSQVTACSSLSVLLERCGALAKPLGPAVLQAAPHIWQAGEGQSLLRIQA